jgi:hypothetical protein
MGSNAAGTGKTVTVLLEAAETGWEIAPGHVVPGYGFSGQVPGPPSRRTSRHAGR